MIQRIFNHVAHETGIRAVIAMTMSPFNQSIHSADDTQPVELARPRMRVTAERIGLQTIRTVVHDFYANVRRDPVLGQRFEAAIQDWPAHEAKLTHFWWVALGGPVYAPYRYQVIDAHLSIDVEDHEIEHWLGLFADTMRAQLPAPETEEWLGRAQAMGRSLALAAGSR